MDSKILYSHWIFSLPFISLYDGIVLGRYIILKTSKENTPAELLEHELVHQRQMKEFGVLKFYFIYIINYLVNLVKYKNHWDAYYNIPFEKEAYSKQNGNSPIFKKEG